jgi:predicted kinase
MREWMRERMRRRTKRGPNTSESTGKIGQEIPANQPAPLRPSYPDAQSLASLADETVEPHEDVADEPSGVFADASEPQELEQQEPVEVPAVSMGEPAGKLVMETQPESLGTPPPEQQAAAQRSPRGFVVLTIGLPGSGKTTWFKRRGVTPLSSDLLRTILFDDITEQRYQGLVFSTLRSLLRARLIAKMPWNYVDATNLSPHERRQWIKMAKSFGYDVQAVFFDVPFDVCMERNQRRERTVSDETMHKMAERLRPPSFKEGFSKITVVRVKGQPAPTPESAMSAPVPPDALGDDTDGDDEGEE